MFILWLFSIVFYWSNAPFLGLLTLLAGASYSIIKLESFSKTDVLVYLLSLGILSSSWYYGFYLYSNTGSLLTYLHTLALASLMFFVKPKLDYKALYRFAYFFSLISTFFIIIGKLFFEEVFYYKTATGVKRYEFIFAEPSFLGIFCCLLLFFLLRVKLTKKTQVVTVLLLVVNILFTASGAGIALLAAILLLRINFSFSSIIKLSIGFSLSLSILAFTTSIPDLIYSRFERVMSGNYDTSTKIRFVAPALITRKILKDSPLFGVGLGNTDYYLRKDYSSYDYLLKKDSTGKYLINTNIDNVWVNILFSSGLFGLLGFLLLFLYRVMIGSLHIKTLVFISFTFFFCGAFIHPLFFGILNFKYEDDK